MNLKKDTKLSHHIIHEDTTEANIYNRNIINTLNSINNHKVFSWSYDTLEQLLHFIQSIAYDNTRLGSLVIIEPFFGYSEFDDVIEKILDILIAITKDQHVKNSNFQLYICSWCTIENWTKIAQERCQYLLEHGLIIYGHYSLRKSTDLLINHLSQQYMKVVE